MWLYVAPQPTPPEPVDDTDDELDARRDKFYAMGFDPLVALALAWNQVSPADVRERYLKQGATHDQVARILA